MKPKDNQLFAWYQERSYPTQAIQIPLSYYFISDKSKKAEWKSSDMILDQQYWDLFYDITAFVKFEALISQ